MRSVSALLCALFLPVCPSARLPVLQAQDAADIRSKVRSYREANESRIVGELRDLLAIPNNANDAVNIRRNADFLVAMLSKRGVSARLLEAEGSPPAVYGELSAPGAVR